MNTNDVKNLLTAAVAALTLSTIGTSATACPNHQEHKTSQLPATGNPPKGSIASAEKAQELSTIKTNIELLDQNITESLEKITEDQDLEFLNPLQQNKYDSEIAIEKRNLEKAEQKLSLNLKKMDKLKASTGSWQ